MTNESTSADQLLEEEFQRISRLDTTLNERLSAYSAAVSTYAPEFAEAYDNLVARLRSGEAGSAAPQCGEAMPAFALLDVNLRIHRLNEMLAHGPVVVSLNRGHWCEYCTLELAALNKALSEFAATGVKVVSIMPEMPAMLKRASNNGAITVLSDQENGYALTLNLVIWLGELIPRMLLECGVSVEQSQGNSAYFVPIPATFVIGQDARVIARFVDPDFRKRMEIEDILAALRSVNALAG